MRIMTVQPNKKGPSLRPSQPNNNAANSTKFSAQQSCLQGPQIMQSFHLKGRHYLLQYAQAIQSPLIQTCYTVHPRHKDFLFLRQWTLKHNPCLICPLPPTVLHLIKPTLPQLFCLVFQIPYRPHRPHCLPPTVS
ncbi:unnamed protein product [Dovyalis caffra]|uniref:Uncharacterized protein n=1 Tax=Dovyalis caffra TaxID=77055 RepID=A0AAV1RIB6_9ROSI|nr:unnamed protein product [Dovyalis caffra]